MSARIARSRHRRAVPGVTAGREPISDNVDRMSVSGPPAAVRGRGRQLLLEAARQIFAERGYRGTSTRDIAERAGVTEVMIFRHFSNKANLFQEAVVDPFVTFVNKYISDYRSREHGRLSPEEEGRALYSGLLDVLTAERGILFALTVARQYDELPAASGAQVDAAFDHVLTVLEEVVGTEARERGFTVPDLAATVRAMFSMVLSVALHGEWLGIGRRASLPEVIEAMTILSVRGLGVPNG
jgi:AcrR family transcriptional regulator